MLSAQKIFQAGSIQLKSGTSLNGYIFDAPIKNIEPYIWYKKSLREKKQKLDLKDIEAVTIFKKRKYESVRILLKTDENNPKYEWKTRLLKVLEEGKLKLYSYEVGSEKWLYLRTQKGELKRLETYDKIHPISREKMGEPDTLGTGKIRKKGLYKQDKHFLYVLRSATIDCMKPIHPKTRLNSEKIKRILRAFNKCQNNQVQAASYFTKKFNFKPKIAFNLYKLNREQGVYFSNWEWQLEVGFPDVTERVSVSFLYNHLRLTSEEVQNSQTTLFGNLNRDGYLDIATLRIHYFPIPQRKFQPYIAVGVTHIRPYQFTRNGFKRDYIRRWKPHLSLGAEYYIYKQFFGYLEVSEPFFPNLKVGLGYKF